jgi:hypothetical protein
MLHRSRRIDGKLRLDADLRGAFKNLNPDLAARVIFQERLKNVSVHGSRVTDV